MQRAASVRSAAPAGGGQHRRGECFLQRRVALVLAPAALEQRFARGIDIQRGAGGGQVQHQLQVRRVRVHIRPLAGALAQLVAHGILDAQCGEIQAAQRAALRGGVDAQRVAWRDPLCPVHALRQCVQVVLVPVVGAGHLDQHALRQPAAQVQRHQAGGVGVQRNAATPRFGRRAGQQRADFIAQQRFDTGGAGQEQAQRGAHGLMPCAGWPARSSAPRGTWRPCAAPP